MNNTDTALLGKHQKEVRIHTWAIYRENFVAARAPSQNWRQEGKGLAAWGTVGTGSQLQPSSPPPLTTSLSAI